MKISVSLPDEDVEFLDSYAESQGYGSRSAVVHTAVRLLRSAKPVMPMRTHAVALVR